MDLSYVYILKCSDKSYYTGITSDLRKRLNEHEIGKYLNSYTFKRRPVELVYFSMFMDIRKAIQREKQIKNWSRAKKEALIRGEYEELPNLARKNFQ